ncbi:MAG: hypothetical protein KBG28_25735 [Kofleriaceae bacterium]|nr:hypothetical protein [Kofleriaceae bacterium]
MAVWWLTSRFMGRGAADVDSPRGLAPVQTGGQGRGPSALPRVLPRQRSAWLPMGVPVAPAAPSIFQRSFDAAVELKNAIELRLIETQLERAKGCREDGDPTMICMLTAAVRVASGGEVELMALEVDRCRPDDFTRPVPDELARRVVTCVREGLEAPDEVYVSAEAARELVGQDAELEVQMFLVRGVR